MSFLTNTTSSANTVWFPSVITSKYLPDNTWYLMNTTTTTSTSTNGTLILPNYKKCRICLHAHLVDNDGCIEVVGLSNSVTFIGCPCKEYVPSDNLEYLEYLDKKKENKYCKHWRKRNQKNR